ncbi:MAG: minor capsid protein [Bacteroidales bacterium]|nr:minor capsid protein [Bacteroidales bacterium]
MMKTPNEDYWISRALRLEQEIQNNATVTVNRIINIYIRAFKNIERDIKKLTDTYKGLDGLSDEELEKYLTRAEHDKNASDLRKIYNSTDDKQIKQELSKRINAQAYGFRIKRLEGLRLAVYNEIKKAGIAEISLTKKLYEESIKAGYYRTIDDIARGYNVGIRFDILPQRAIDNALKTRWSGKNFSERVWKNTDDLAERAQGVIVGGLQSGQSYTKMASEIERLSGKGTYSSTRLVRTECNYFMNQGVLEGYKESDIKKYKFVATLDLKTSELCAGLDGLINDVVDAMVGVNYPPMHPHCRSVAIMADILFDGARIARNPITGKNYKIDNSVTYKEWYAGLSDEQKQAIVESRSIASNKSSDKKQYANLA